MRRRLIVHGVLLLCLLTTAAPSWAAIAFVQARTVDVANFDSTTLAYNSNVTSGTLLGMCGGVWNGNDSSPIAVTDTLGTSYTVLEGIVTGGTPIRAWIAYGIAPSGGANTVTFNPAGGGRYGSFTIFEFSGIDSSPLDVDGDDTVGTSTTPSDGITTVAADALVIGCMTHGGSGSQTITEDTGGGWTLLGEVQNTSNAPHGAQYQIFSSAGAKTASWTLGASLAWDAMTASFKASTGAANVSQFYRRRAR